MREKVGEPGLVEDTRTDASSEESTRGFATVRA